MKTDSKTTTATTRNDAREMSAAEIDCVSGGSFKLAAPGGNYYLSSPSGPLRSGYRMN